MRQSQVKMLFYCAIIYRLAAGVANSSTYYEFDWYIYSLFGRLKRMISDLTKQDYWDLLVDTIAGLQPRRGLHQFQHHRDIPSLLAKAKKMTYIPDFAVISVKIGHFKHTDLKLFFRSQPPPPPPPLKQFWRKPWIELFIVFLGWQEKANEERRLTWQIWQKKWKDTCKLDVWLCGLYVRIFKALKKFVMSRKNILKPNN